MEKKNTGGPAFPVNELHQSTGHMHEQHMGLSVRDYFAARAMVALVGAHDDKYDSNAELAADAYVVADAMLKARES